MIAEFKIDTSKLTFTGKGLPTQEFLKQLS